VNPVINNCSWCRFRPGTLPRCALETLFRWRVRKTLP
jgi:hypothetical protein